jgi:hypothetical protein
MREYNSNDAAVGIADSTVEDTLVNWIQQQSTSAFGIVVFDNIAVALLACICPRLVPRMSEMGGTLRSTRALQILSSFSVAQLQPGANNNW